MTWRRLSMWIRLFWADPKSQLFAAIKQSMAPPAPTGLLDSLTPYQQMQMIEWTSEREGLLVVANDIRALIAATVQAEQPLHVRPWENDDGDAARNAERLDEYNSPEAQAARAAVTGGPIPEPRGG